jgi:hypothetical protein
MLIKTFDQHTISLYHTSINAMNQRKIYEKRNQYENSGLY